MALGGFTPRGIYCIDLMVERQAAVARDADCRKRADFVVLHAARALTPEGWKSDVRVTIEDGAIAAVETGAEAGVGTNVTRSWRRRRRICTAMPSSGRWRGWPSPRRQIDTFWTWRETMYRFALHMSPDDVEAVAAQLYVEMLEAGFAAVAEFHYLHHAPDGSPYELPAEMAGRILSAARRGQESKERRDASLKFL